MKLLHTMIRVSDIKKSLDFYQNILGLELSRTKELKDATLYFLTDEEKSFEIELTYNHQAPQGGYEIGSGFGHFALSTDNMDEFSKKLKENNYEYFREPFILSGHSLKIAFIKDPDGYQVEIIEK